MSETTRTKKKVFSLMTNGNALSLRLLCKRPLPVMCFAALMLGGCVCTDADQLVWDDRAWDAAFLAADADHAGPECNAEGVARRSELWAEFAGRANPDLLRAARRDAERECSTIANANGGYASLK